MENEMVEEEGDEEEELPPSRTFTDELGRTWHVTFRRAGDEAALEFVSASESREPKRAMLVSTSFTFSGVTDNMLIAWLASSPRLGWLSE
jgi:hypothetical protein